MPEERIQSLDLLRADIAGCTICEDHLEAGCRPVVHLSDKARCAIIGQAPGRRVHDTGIPWNDPSGDRLRRWLALGDQPLHERRDLAIMPMGFCYPGKGSSGDLPPRRECAPQWHQRCLEQMPEVALILLIGQYAQQSYLPASFLKAHPRLKDRVWHYEEVPAPFFPLPHPSPRNRRWFGQNPWFETEVIPALQQRLLDSGIAPHTPP